MKSTMTVYPNGGKIWSLNGKLHRVDGPAMEKADGGKSWYLDGKCHRVDGPAIERADGNKFWLLNDNLHRVDGPAIEYADGSKLWYIDGKELTLMQFIDHDLVTDEMVAEVLMKWI